MSEPLIIACPHCASKLKIKNASAIGKKIRCPRCETGFVVQAPREDPPSDDWDSVGESASDPEDDFLSGLGSLTEGMEKAPPARRTTPPPVKRKKSAEAADDEEADRPKKRKRRRDSGEVSFPVLVWIAFGLAGGLIGGLIWVGVGYAASREVGWIAIGVGFFVGLGVRIGAVDRDGYGPGVLAIAISIVVILASKFVVAYLISGDRARNILADLSDDGLKRVLAIAVGEEQESKRFRRRRFQWSTNWYALKKIEEFPDEIQAQVQLVWELMSAEEKAEFKSKLIERYQASRGTLAVREFFDSFGLFDILWVFLAAGAAFRVGSGMTTGES
jgi:predicted Zn finger-like uncharacterized protein